MFLNDQKEVEQLLICAEGDVILDIDSQKIVDGLIHLMASYYVFDVSYPKECQNMFFFFQDIIMEKKDGGKRPVRYSSYISSIGF